MSILVYTFTSMSKKMISIRFNEKLLEHLKKLDEVKKGNLTSYIERACTKVSGYKEKRRLLFDDENI